MHICDWVAHGFALHYPIDLYSETTMARGINKVMLIDINIIMMEMVTIMITIIIILLADLLIVTDSIIIIHPIILIMLARLDQQAFC